jgi:hypothetical protein
VERNDESDDLMRELGLATGRDRYTIQSSGEPGADDKTVLQLQTRPVIGIMHHLSRGVEVPEADLASGVASPVPGIDDLFRVRASDSRPTEPCVAVRHRGHWFYVPDADSDSKQTFALVRAIYQLQLAGNEHRSGPLLTPPLD